MRSARMLQTLLAVFLASTSEALAREPIVRKSDPAVVTHRLKIGDITVGFSDKGGGYLNYLDTGDGKNIVSAKYGRGWQGSLRDQLHSGRYNPTQAGFTDYAGVPVKLVLTDKKLTIPSFNLPLYGDPVFDFTQHEDLVPDFRGYKDKGKTDTDGLDESEWSQDDELRSEFDFEGFYENATALGGGKIPILRFYSRYTYARSPRAILQFGKKAKKKDGKPVINEKARIADVSRTMPGRQAPTDVDLSKIIFTAYGIRLLTSSGYTTPMWHEGGKWRSLTLKDIRGRGKEKTFELAASKTRKFRGNKILNSQFLLLAKGSDPNKSRAIALYCPASGQTNSKQILGLDRKTGRVIYREDRRERSVIMFSHVIPTQVGIRSRFFISGMLAPDHGNPKAVEALQHDTYVLFGTPAEILRATQILRRKAR